jgi:hypothetical protein
MSASGRNADNITTDDDNSASITTTAGGKASAITTTTTRTTRTGGPIARHRVITTRVIPTHDGGRRSLHVNDPQPLGWGL